MRDEFSHLYDERKILVSEFLHQNIRTWGGPRSPAIQTLMESVEYSLLQGGKRFRPVLCLMLAESFGVSPKKILPWAASIELVHTYSLIHDDLPCMDDDDMRRGMATNHKVFGEATALLAGDALLTESFLQIALHFEHEPEKMSRLIRILGEAAGVQGMIGGQAMDMSAQKDGLSIPELNLMHGLKTGALIRAATEGTAVVMGLPVDSQEKCRQFGELLGLAFQLKDDLLDSQDEIEKGTFAEALGLAETQKYLEEVHLLAQHCLEKLSILEGPLHQLLQMNNQRQK